MTTPLKRQWIDTRKVVAAWRDRGMARLQAAQMLSSERSLDWKSLYRRADSVDGSASESPAVLRACARMMAPPDRAIRAAVSLQRMGAPDAAALLFRLVRDPDVRACGDGRLLRAGLREARGEEHFLAQAASALVLLEQMRDGFRNITWFRQALDVLRFLETPLPTDMARRGIVLRTAGGENLDLVRLALEDREAASLEHVCLARKDVVLTLVSGSNRRRAFELLRQTLAHPNHAVRLTALYGFARLRDPSAVPLLQQLAQSARDPLANDAERALSQIPRRPVDAAVLLRSSSAEIRSEEMLRSADARCEDERKLLRARQHST